MSTAPSVPHRACPPPTTVASRSTRPRSSTGACAPTAPPRKVPEHCRSPNPERNAVTEKPDAVVGEMNEEGQGCPFTSDTHRHPTVGASNRDWWPNQLNLKILRK